MRNSRAKMNDIFDENGGKIRLREKTTSFAIFLGVRRETR